MDADVEEKLQCDFNTTHHHDVVALPNVESMVEDDRGFRGEGGRHWLRDFPNLSRRIWNSAIGKAMHGIMNLFLFECLYERNSRANEWYFFSRVNKKHANGSRLSRSIAGRKDYGEPPFGVKKVRGYNGQLLGKRTPLNYYEGKNSKAIGSCKNTSWRLHKIIAHPTSKASTSKSSTVIGHQLREISYNFNSVCAKEGLEEDYMVPQVPYYDQYINVGEAQGGTINSEEAMLPLMIVNQGHPSALVPFVPQDDNVANMGSVNNIASTSPILLEDYHLVEKLANFDRERIPERVVHAGELVQKGNFDLVGNNFPVFFIRDGMKFPDMVHALKPNPKSHIQENWRVLDFFSHHPESLHMFTFLFDDIGIPQDYRHMDGSGVNTYTLINKAGKAHYVKFHWRPTCGAHNCSTNLACRGRCWFVRRTGRGWWRFALWRGKGVVAVRVLEDPDQLQEAVTWEETGNTVGLRGGRRGRRPQTASYRKSKESTRVTNASDVAEVHDETSAVNASVTATAGKEIEVHKSQVTTAETSSSDSIEEEQDESQEQEVDGEEAEQSK
ncbi:hypothetical protein Sjap_026646 [Stephania japonica]|uniref:catalase n=1 Tax=Stephania japonica TaxID=461633 RepID=A0AAP0HEH9_9MAGN